MAKCSVENCDNEVSKEGHTLCLEHWKEANPKSKKKRPTSSTSLSATAIGERLDISNRRINLILSELGWTSRDRKGWVATAQGLALGAEQKEHSRTGIPYVTWPQTILSNKALKATVKSLLQGEQADGSDATAFREKYQANFRATDGHFVRSKAEMLIDNWLYMSGIVHAYERQLPVEEELYCDFYIPEGKVYIEYWGLESDPKYAMRKEIKLGVYRKYNFNLIELSEEHVNNLDEHLPRLLLKYNIIVS